MSQKLLIVVAVQSALVLGVGGAALGLSAGRGGPAHAPRSGKRHVAAARVARSEDAAPRAKAKGSHQGDEGPGGDGSALAHPPGVAHAGGPPASGAAAARPTPDDHHPEPVGGAAAARPTPDDHHPEPVGGAAKTAGAAAARPTPDDHHSEPVGAAAKTAGAAASAPPGGAPAGALQPASPDDGSHRPAMKSDVGHPAGPLRDDELHPLPHLPREPLEAFAWLDEGNNRWANGLSRPRDLVRLRRELAAGYAPWASVVSCSDGRAVPEAVFDAPPGALVTIKVPVFAADAALAASVEVALKRHPVPVLVLLGHAGCDDGTGRAVEEQVTAVAAKLMGRAPLRERARAGKLLMLRAVYGLETGRVRWLDSEEAAHDESAHR